MEKQNDLTTSLGRMQSGRPRIAIVATHPIQYHVPWFRALEESGLYDLTVLFGILPDDSQQGIGFGVRFTWDIPMLEGYTWKKLDNVSESPDLGRFSGCDTPGISRVLKELNPDIVILTGWQSKMLIQAGWAARKLKVPAIMRGESNALRHRQWFKRLFHGLYLNRFDGFLTIGKSNRQFYLNNGITADLLYDAPYFVDNARFLASIEGKTLELGKKRQSLSIDPHAFCFVYSGKLEEKKNVVSLMQCFAKLYKIKKDVHFLMMGDGELRAELESLIAKFNLPVTMTGFVNQSEIPSLYAIGNCFLLGSDYGETWGLVVNEAMICGLPAIVSDRVGCGSDLIIEGETGYVYPFTDSDKLVELMLKMAENPEAAATMGATARDHVLDHYNVEKTVNGTEKAISALLN